MQTERLLADDAAIARAAELLRQGALVSFPTETVYGLGANGLIASAIDKIYAAKGRPRDNPMILHVSTVEMAMEIAEVSSLARQLIERFWPGPLTLVLPAKEIVPENVRAKLPTIAVRMPDNEIALQLIEACGFPLAAPSANTSGKPSPTTAQHVLDDLEGRIPLVLDGGACTFGIESTVVDLTSDTPTLLRPGTISIEDLQEIIPQVKRVTKMHPARSPGMKYRHYAPIPEMILIQTHNREQLERILNQYQNKHVEIISTEPLPQSNIHELSKNKTAIAKELFGLLRSFTADVDVLICFGITKETVGEAVLNRLTKAATRVIT